MCSIFTSSESTLGTGQNTCLGTDPAILHAPYQRALTLGDPYALDPGVAARRSATSACTITSTVRSEGRVERRCKVIGTEVLYGRFATSAVGSPSTAVTASASAVMIDTCWLGKYFSRVRGSASARRGSISMTLTRAPASTSPRVSEPSPGPTSRT